VLHEYQHHARNDQWVAEIVFPDRRDGYFVEAGACGGVRQSSTYVLETDLGWTGICVEPVDEYYEILERRRSCATDRRCLSDTTGGTIEFLSFVEDPARSGILATNKSVPWAEQRNFRSVTTIKETVTLADLLEQHHAPRTVDYVGLDVEGAEQTILGAFDFSADRTILALSVEGHRCDDLLAAEGYIKVTNPHRIGFPDQYFVHPCLEGRVAHLRVH
jgi:FkbM family methyltransferase